MAKSTSTYGKSTPVYGPFRPAPHGLCSIHRTALLEDGTECWDCGPGVPVTPYAPQAASPAPATLSPLRELADTVRRELARAEASEPSVVASLRGVLNDARQSGVLDGDMLQQVLDILRATEEQAVPVPAPRPAPRPSGDVKGGAWLAVPDGYYATASRTGNNDLDFWMVKTVAGGDWAGFRSVSRVIGGRADERVKGGERRAALEAIEADPEAGMRFATELGHCMRCNRHLTDEASRARGLGPECASKL